MAGSRPRPASTNFPRLGGRVGGHATWGVETLSTEGVITPPAKGPEIHSTASIDLVKRVLSFPLWEEGAHIQGHPPMSVPPLFSRRLTHPVFPAPLRFRWRRVRGPPRKPGACRLVSAGRQFARPSPAPFAFPLRTAYMFGSI